MKIYCLFRMLVILSGVLTCSTAWAAEMALPAHEANSNASSEVSQQLRKGAADAAIYMPPVFDNIVQEGLKLPEETVDGTPEETDDVTKNNATKTEDQTSREVNIRPTRP